MQGNEGKGNFMVKQNNRAVGKQYESYAAEYLTKQGMKVLCRNFLCRQGEIDLIGEAQGCLVFVEVKYRKDASRGLPEEAVGIAKQKRICQVAEYFLYTHPKYRGWNVRYDVIAICGTLVHWYPGAFSHIGLR